MSELARQVQARKARLKRFAESAARHVNKSAIQAEKEQVALLERYLMPRLLLPVATPKPERAVISSTKVPLVQRILRAVALEFDLTIAQIVDQDRHATYTLPRFVAVGLFLEMTNLTLPAIGRRLGGRDNATIWHARYRIEALLESEAFRNRFDQIKAEIGQ